MLYKVIGLHRDTGADIERIFEGQTEQDALDQAFDENLVVQKVKLIRGSHKPLGKPIEESVQEPVEEPTEKPTEKPIDKAAVMAERRARVYEEAAPRTRYVRPSLRQQLNDAGVIALGIFVGLLAFSIFEPIVKLVIIGVMMGAGRESNPSPFDSLGP